MRIRSAFWTTSLSYLSRRDKARVARTSRGIRTAISSRMAWSTRDWCLNLMFCMHVTKCDWNAAERLFVELDTPADFAAFSAVLALERCGWAVGTSFVLVARALRLVLPFQATHMACRLVVLVIKRRHENDVRDVFVPGIDKVDTSLVLSASDALMDDLMVSIAECHEITCAAVSSRMLDSRGIVSTGTTIDKLAALNHPRRCIVMEDLDDCKQCADQGYVPATFLLATKYEIPEYQAAVMQIWCLSFEMWLEAKRYNQGLITRERLVIVARSLLRRGEPTSLFVLAKQAQSEGDQAHHDFCMGVFNGRVKMSEWHPFASLKFTP